MPNQTKTLPQNIFPSFLRETISTLSSHQLFPVMLDTHVIDRLVNVEGVELDTWLHKDEVDKYHSYALPKRKLEYLTGRISAKMSIVSFLEKNSPLNTIPAPCEIIISNLETGRPTYSFGNTQIFSGPKDISISHSSQYACASSCKNTCGIDIQNCNSTLARVKDKFCSPVEESTLSPTFNSLGTLTTLSLLWSAKEAIKKTLSTVRMPGFLEIHLKEITVHKESVYQMHFHILENDLWPSEIPVIATFFDDYAIALSSLNP